MTREEWIVIAIYTILSWLFLVQPLSQKTLESMSLLGVVGVGWSKEKMKSTRRLQRINKLFSQKTRSNPGSRLISGKTITEDGTKVLTMFCPLELNPVWSYHRKITSFSVKQKNKIKHTAFTGIQKKAKWQIKIMKCFIKAFQTSSESPQNARFVESDWADRANDSIINKKYSQNIFLNFCRNDCVEPTAHNSKTSFERRKWRQKKQFL